jgi:hypothetical protein
MSVKKKAAFGYIKIARTKKKTEPFGHMTARLFDSHDGTKIVKVPIRMTTVPEIPQVVIYKDFCFTLENSAPLSYREALGGIAKDL